MDARSLLKRLLTCSPAHIDVLETELGLNPAFLPGANEAVATRAKAIVDLLRPRGERGLKALDTALNEMFGESETTDPEPDNDSKSAQVILLLFANPLGTDPLALKEEQRTIERVVGGGSGRIAYRVEPVRAVGATELSQLLLKHRPRIVHFSGHGSDAGGIILEGDMQQANEVSPQMLSRLFRAIEGTQVVVLNACYSAAQAAALAKCVPNVIGMTREVGDDAAIRFSEGFYLGLASGLGLEKAFELGCAQIDLAGLPESLTPHFLKNGIESS